MKHLKSRGWRAAWVAAGIAVTGVAAAGVANAATTTGTATPTPSANAQHSKALRAKELSKIERQVAAKATHGEIVLDTKKGLQTVDFQRGVISDASTSGFTVTDKGGTTESWTASSATKVRARSGKGAKASSGQIVNGETAVVIGLKDGDTLTARLVVVLSAAQHSAQPTT